MSNNFKKAAFAAGCFWGVQYYFDQLPGVIGSRVGYIGGHAEDPSYEDVCYKDTGHAEAVELEYDSDQVDYETLVKHFFRMHDPTQLNRQGPDIGDQYRSVIFYLSKEQARIANNVKEKCQINFKDRIVTQIVPATVFYEAEDYHQKYTQKTGRGMCHVRYEPL